MCLVLAQELGQFVINSRIDVFAVARLRQLVGINLVKGGGAYHGLKGDEGEVEKRTRLNNETEF